jgi:hypothetical protein
VGWHRTLSKIGLGGARKTRTTRRAPLADILERLRNARGIRLLQRNRASLGALALLAAASPAHAEGATSYGPLLRDTWGEIGLLDIPSARMADDGQLSFTFAAMQNTQRYNFALQVVPWAEAYFRYGHIDGANRYSDYHRNLGFKIRLFEETAFWPEISIGARDIIGTGRQGAEYLVASKQLWDFDITAGFGWGRLSSNDVFENPFGLLFKSFKTRTVAPPTGGTPDYGQLFHGPYVGIFGGITWDTPISGLDLIAEYSSDNYSDEVAKGVMKVRSPVNIGLSYAPMDDLRIQAGWLYGATFGASLTYIKDPTQSVFPSRLGPPKPPPHIRSDADQVTAMNGLYATRDGEARWLSMPVAARQQQMLTQALYTETRNVRDAEVDGKTLMVDATYYENADTQCRDYARVAAASGAQVTTIALTNSDDASGAVALCPVGRPAGPLLISANDTGDRDAVIAKVRADVGVQQLEFDALAVEKNQVWLYYRNHRYLTQDEAAGRLTRVLMQDMPASVEIFHLVLVDHGIAIREFQISRSAMERSAMVSGGTEELADAVALKLPPTQQIFLDRSLALEEPRLSWSIGPGLRQSFFDPSSPIQIEVEWTVNGDLELAPGLDLIGEADGNVYNNFNLKRPANSDLPHVRSDITQYLKHGINGVGDLELDYRTRLAPDLYADLRAGYLEDMYGGVGGQILWRPEGSRFSYGVDLYQVWKRAFDRLYGFQSYNILTGHVSVYYNSPWYGLNFNVHAGRYLAGDYGATIEVTRKFLTGVEIGAFATFTNVPFSKFGEGSFDKGFIVRIPFEWSLPIYTTSTKTTVLHSLTRDGGQRLNNDDPLYQETRDASYGELLDHIDQMTEP